jgi:hypothetical protein
MVGRLIGDWEYMAVQIVVQLGLRWIEKQKGKKEEW